MALVVLFDAYCNCSDIDARADGQMAPPQFISMGAAWKKLVTGALRMFSMYFFQTFGVIVNGDCKISEDMTIP